MYTDDFYDRLVDSPGVVISYIDRTEGEFYVVFA